MSIHSDLQKMKTIIVFWLFSRRSLGLVWGPWWRCLLEASPRRPKGVPKASQRFPQGVPRRPQGVPKASQKRSKSVPKASKGVPEAPQGDEVLQARGKIPKVSSPLTPSGSTLAPPESGLGKKHPQKTNDSTAVWHFLDYFLILLGVPVRGEFLRWKKAPLRPDSNAR